MVASPVAIPVAQARARVMNHGKRHFRKSSRISGKALLAIKLLLGDQGESDLTIVEPCNEEPCHEKVCTDCQCGSEMPDM